MKQRSVWFVLVGMWLGAFPAAAQSDFYGFTGINFDFTNPGARARGIGGAFVAIADDSTAALANPAGLAYLPRELSLEWVRDEESYPVGQLTQGDVDFAVDGSSWVYTPRGDPHRVRAESSRSRANHASVVLPIEQYRLTASLYYGVLADLRSSYRVGDGLGCVSPDGGARLPGADQPCVFDLVDTEGSDLPFLNFGQDVVFDVSTEVLGAAVAYRFSDTWSVGGSIAVGQTEHETSAEIDRSVVGQENQIEVGDVDDRALLYSAGVLYREDRWGFGASYRSASRYAITGLLLDAAGEPIEDRAIEGQFTVPERIAAGVAVFPSDRWVVAAEVTRVAYSQVLERMDPLNRQMQNAGVEYRISDVTELHLGAEYTTFVDRRGWSVRLGWWRDRTHLPWVDEASTDPRGDELDLIRLKESLFRAPFEEDVDHYTFGLGLAGERVRVDAAVDWSPDAGTDVLVSAVLYF